MSFPIVHARAFTAGWRVATELETPTLDSMCAESLRTAKMRPRPSPVHAVADMPVQVSVLTV